MQSGKNRFTTGVGFIGADMFKHWNASDLIMLGFAIFLIVITIAMYA